MRRNDLEREFDAKWDWRLEHMMEFEIQKLDYALALLMVNLDRRRTDQTNELRRMWLVGRDRTEENS